MVNPLLVLLISLILAYIFSEVLKVFKLPRVIGQLAAGFILGIPLIKQVLFTPEINSIFSFFANIGIILLFYFVGLEINVGEFKRYARTSSLVAIFNTGLPLLAGFLVSFYGFDLSLIESLVIGISLGVSSQAISLDILEELNLLKSRIGKFIIMSGAVDDIFEFLLVSVLLIIFHIAAGSAYLSTIVLGIFAFMILVIVMRSVLIPFALRQFERENSPTSLFMGSLIIVVSIAYLAEVFKIGSLIGALVAGMLVRQVLLTGKKHRPWEEHSIARSVHLISFGMFVPVFFVWVGVNTSLSGVITNLPLIGTLIVIDIVGTVLGTMLGIVLSGNKFREGLIVGWGLLPKGDTELVIATLALTSNLISLKIFSAIILSSFIVTIIAPIVFNRLVKKYKRTVM